MCVHVHVCLCECMKGISAYMMIMKGAGEELACNRE